MLETSSSSTGVEAVWNSPEQLLHAQGTVLHVRDLGSGGPRSYNEEGRETLARARASNHRGTGDGYVSVDRQDDQETQVEMFEEPCAEGLRPVEADAEQKACASSRCDGKGGSLDRADPPR